MNESGTVYHTQNARFSRCSSVDDEEARRSRQELRQKSKEIQTMLAEKNQKHRRVQSNSSRQQETSSDLYSVGNINDQSAVSDISSHQSNSSFNPNARREKEKRLKHVFLTPDFRSLSGNESSGVEICKRLFGIAIFEYSNGKSKWNNMTKDRKLVVQGVTDSSESQASGNIHRGDMLVRINDVTVSWLNFTRLLRSLKKREKVKLTFQSPRIVGPKSSCNVLQVPEADVCLAVLGKRLNHIQYELSHFDCVALFLTLAQSSSEAEANEKEDIIYAFPPGEAKLTALRGLFITLSSSLVDVVGQAASSSKMTMNGSNINVVYRQSGKDVLVLAMPENRISLKALSSIIDSLYSLLVLLFSDVQSAFSDCDRTWLDKVIALMFHDALGLQSSLPSPSTSSALLSVDRLTTLSCGYLVVKSLQLNDENKLICDEILSELESMDFDDILDQNKLFNRRKYTIQGTSLFYKNYLVCTHLSEELQKYVNLFLNCHGLLALSSRQPVDQVMVWQEMKPTWSPDSTCLPAGYRPCNTRSFLMVVGWKHYYLSMVLEAGGCSQGIQGQARPLGLMMEQGKGTLTQLETKEVCMSAVCEERLSSTVASVSIACVDHLVTTSSPRNRAPSQSIPRQALTPSKTTSDNHVKFRSKSMDRLVSEERRGGIASSQDTSAVAMKRQGSKLSYGSNDSAGSGSSAGPASKGKSSHISSLADLSSITRSVSVLQIEAPYDFIRAGRISRGKENSLFGYIQLDFGSGLVISPTDVELMGVHSSLQDEVIHKFCSACRKMRAIFARKNSSKMCVQSEGSQFSSDVDGELLEQGTLFQVVFQAQADKKRVSTLCYWVLGRCWLQPDHKEMYVCFHESTDQSLVEMAFSSGFVT